MTHNNSHYLPCNLTAAAVAASSTSSNHTNCMMPYETEWPLERIVSMVVPVFFGIIGLIGLMGNALVIIGK